MAYPYNISCVALCINGSDGRKSRLFERIPGVLHNYVGFCQYNEEEECNKDENKDNYRM